jgi:serine/threonine protein kinase
VLSSYRIKQLFVGLDTSALCKIRSCPLRMVSFLLATPSCTYWVLGGMGEVYLVQHPRLPRMEALKILPEDVSADPEFRQRFAREADIASSLWHPHIVAVHDRGEHDGQLWIAMDYVEGTDAAQLVRNRYPHGMPPKDALEITSAIADALDYAHERYLLHRDVKPANILLTESRSDGKRILLADFGYRLLIAEGGARGHVLPLVERRQTICALRFRRNSRRSSANKPGCSVAMKCPPCGNIVHRCGPYCSSMRLLGGTPPISAVLE